MENKIKWKVVCSGSTLEGIDEQQAIKNLAQLKVDEIQAKKLVSGSPITVKKDLDQAIAYRLKTRLEKAGLQVKLERMPRSVTPTEKALALEPIKADEEISTAAPKSGSPSLQPGEMECPKCKKVQGQTNECLYCGIIISRYIERQKRESVVTSPYNGDATVKESEDVQKSFWEGGLGKVAIIAAAVSLVFIVKTASHGGEHNLLGNTPEAKAQIEAVLEIAKLETPDLEKIRRLLEAGRYGEVELILRGLDDKTRSNIIWESPYQSVIDSISPENNFRLESLNAWVGETQSAWAYLARGSYYTSAAGIARGTAWAKDTSEAQFSSYRSLQKRAYQNLQRAKDRNSDLLPIYSLLLMVADTQGSHVSLQAILDEAISVNPAGYYYRYQYLRILMPKWGGSYRQMKDFTDATSPYYSLNPRLWILQGLAKSEEAHIAMNRKDYSACIALYSEALQYGASANWLRHRAHCYSRIKEYDLAMEDVDLSLEIYEDDFARRLHNWLKTKV